MVDDARERLLGRLEAIGSALERRGDAVALIGLGSVGRDLDRLDEHSDLDFFVVVDDGAKPAYLASLEWLEAAHPVAYSFENTVDGRKALFADGIFAEYAVFTVGELVAAPYAPGRVVWQRDDAPAGLERPSTPPPAGHGFSLEHQANEALTNLYVGLHRDARGERLSGARLIQVHAVDRLIGMLELSGGAGTRQDAYAAERGVERRFGDALPLARMMPGYERNAEAAIVILEWLEQHADVDPTLAAAVRELAARVSSSASPP
jgi:hypothetical protein